jgi:DNA-binding transcriptional LysR family regulator
MELTMELRHLRYFVAVAETQNVLRAATRKLHISQPAVSRQIRDLEDELGVQLFERTGKALSLSEAGSLFLKEARAILERADEAVRKVHAFAQGGERELHIGYTPVFRTQVLSPALRAFQQAMPKVHVKLHDWTSEKIVTSLRDGRLQLAFIVRPAKRGAFRIFASKNYSVSKSILWSHRPIHLRIVARSRSPTRRGNLSWG